MLSERSARLASSFVVLFLIGSGAVFAYATRAPSTGVHQGASGVPSLHPAGATYAGPAPADDSNESRTSSNSTMSGSSTSTRSTTSSSHSTGSTTTTHSSTTSAETHSESQTESSTMSVSHTSTETENETRSTSSTSTHSEHETVTHASQNSTRFTSSLTEHENETETETPTRNVTSSTSGGGHELTFRLVAVNLSSVGVPPGFSAGRGVATVEVERGSLNVQLELQRLNPATRYSLTMSLNGTDRHLGNFTSTSEGTAEVELSVPVQVGSYSVGFSVIDVSTLPKSFVVLVSSPRTLTAVVSQPPESRSSSKGEHSFTTLSAGQTEKDDISEAVSRKLIPVVVHVSNGGINYSVIDHNFTVFVGRLNEDGIQISISAVNGSTPRVILVNLTGSQTLNLQSGSVVVNFDGIRIGEAASLVQVLNPRPTDPPLFIVIGTSAGYQLLVSIPHFSTHVIEILPAVAQAVGNFLAVDGPALALSVLAVTAVFASIYARRTRVRL